MIYTFKTRAELIRHLFALCELSGAMSHSAFQSSVIALYTITFVDGCYTLAPFEL